MCYTAGAFVGGHTHTSSICLGIRTEREVVQYTVTGEGDLRYLALGLETD